MAVVPGSGPSGWAHADRDHRCQPALPGATEVPEDQTAAAHREFVAALRQPCRPAAGDRDHQRHAEEADHAAPSTGQKTRARLVHQKISFMSARNLLYVLTRRGITENDN
jgi:hypothetical protein